MGGMTEFHRDDPGYEAWLHFHPYGFVINIGTPTVPEWKLHRASCWWIQRHPPKLSTHDYRKVCSDDRDALENWGEPAARSSGGYLTPCGHCKP
jgi:hypothetical protein